MMSTNRIKASNTARNNEQNDLSSSGVDFLKNLFISWSLKMISKYNRIRISNQQIYSYPTLSIRIYKITKFRMSEPINRVNINTSRKNYWKLMTVLIEFKAII